MLNLDINEEILVWEALKQSGFNQQSAATLLGISRDALIRKMKKYNISVKKSGA
jgi:DNA-binding NtrC family response regulator